MDPAMFRWYAADMTQAEFFRVTPRSVFLYVGTVLLIFYLYTRLVFIPIVSSALLNQDCKWNNLTVNIHYLLLVLASSSDLEQSNFLFTNEIFLLHILILEFRISAVMLICRINLTRPVLMVIFFGGIVNKVAQSLQQDQESSLRCSESIFKLIQQQWLSSSVVVVRKNKNPWFDRCYENPKEGVSRVSDSERSLSPLFLWT